MEKQAASPCYIAGESTSLTLNELMAEVFAVTKTDLRGYKEETLLRRTEKRMSELGISSLDDYLAYTRKTPEELKSLRQRLFVTVSSFFRDIESFTALAPHIAPLIINKPAHKPFTAWVAGCGTGEEVYSLAMLLLDISHNSGERSALQLVGSDLNSVALAHAATAHYNKKTLRELPEEFFLRFMVPAGTQFEVSKDVQKLCAFRNEDVFAAGFPQTLDLISCRNLLIYLKTERQDQLLSSFHRLLRDDGLLFLGQSESLTPASTRLFSCVDAGNRIYKKRALSGHANKK